MHTKTHFMPFAVSQLPVVQFEHVRTLFDSTQSQESKSEISPRSRQKGKGSEGKGERNYLDWTQNTRNTDWVIVRIAAYFCASLSQIWIPEIEYSQKVSSQLHMLKLDHWELRNCKGHKMVNSAHCRAPLHKLISDLDS